MEFIISAVIMVVGVIWKDWYPIKASDTMIDYAMDTSSELLKKRREGGSITAKELTDLYKVILLLNARGIQSPVLEKVFWDLAADRGNG